MRRAWRCRSALATVLVAALSCGGALGATGLANAASRATTAAAPGLLLATPRSPVKGYRLLIIATHRSGKTQLTVEFARILHTSAAGKGVESRAFLFDQLPSSALSISPSGRSGTLNTGTQLGSFGGINMSFSATGAGSFTVPGCSGSLSTTGGTLRGRFKFHAGPYFGTVGYKNLNAGTASGTICGPPSTKPPTPGQQSCGPNTFGLYAFSPSSSPEQEAVLAVRHGSHLALAMLATRTATSPHVITLDQLGGFELPVSALRFSSGSGTINANLASPFFTSTLGFSGGHAFPPSSGCTFYYGGTASGMTAHFDTLGTVHVTGFSTLIFDG
jgi:hypothetical protein